jgi:hypothetical protein
MLHEGEEERMCVISVKGDQKKETRRPRSRWVDNIKTDLRDIEWGGMD